MKLRYNLEKAIDPGEDFRNILKIIEKAERDTKAINNAVKENLDLEPINLKEWIYPELKI